MARSTIGALTITNVVGEPPGDLLDLSNQPVNGYSLEVQATGDVPGDTFTLYANGVVIGLSVIDYNGFFVVPAKSFKDGVYTLTMTQTNLAGVISARSNRFTVEVLPDPPEILSAAGQPVAGGPVELRGFAESGETILIYADGGTGIVGKGVAGANGVFDITTTADFAAGVHSFTATGTDSAGLASPSSYAFRELVAPPSAPAAPLTLSPNIGAAISGQAFQIHGTGVAGDTVMLYDGSGSVIATSVVSAGGTYVMTTTAPDSVSESLSVSEENSADENVATSPSEIVAIGSGSPGDVRYALRPLAQTIYAANAEIHVASPGDLNFGDVINVSGASSLWIDDNGGSETYNLALPQTLSGVQTIEVTAVVGSTTVKLRDGLNAEVEFSGGYTGGGLNIVGAKNSATIDLNDGTDTVTLGSASETVDGGAGASVVIANTAATAGALLVGGSGGLTFKLSGGGTIAMNPADSGITEVELAAPSATYAFTASGQSGLMIDDLGAGGAQVTLRAAGQIVTGGSGHLTVVDSAAGSDVVKDTAAAINNDVIGGFTGTGNVIDVTNLSLASLTATFTENMVGTAGLLSLADGVHSAAITLFGQIAAAGFSGSAAAAGFYFNSDGAAGTVITLGAPH